MHALVNIEFVRYKQFVWQRKGDRRMVELVTKNLYAFLSNSVEQLRKSQKPLLLYINGHK